MLTWLNPHVYLDALVLIGSISTQYSNAQIQFALGAISASFVFFWIGLCSTLFATYFSAATSLENTGYTYWLCNVVDCGFFSKLNLYLQQL